MKDEEVAEWLLKKEFHLTALELHMELLESGKEIPLLRNFFAALDGTANHSSSNSNTLASSSSSGSGNSGGLKAHHRRPSNSSMSSLQQHAAIDELYIQMEKSELLQQKEERLAVVEFELRQANDTITQLKEALSAAQSGSGAPSQLHLQLPPVDDESKLRSPIKPYEQRAINYLVNSYLLELNYKLTAITFSDEVINQNLESWEDVGANMDQPPRLLEVFRRLYSHVSFKEQGKSKQTSLESEVDSLRSELASTKAFNKKISSENAHLKLQVQELRNSSSQTPASAPTPVPASQTSVAQPAATAASLKSEDSFPRRKLAVPSTPVHHKLIASLQKETQNRIDIEIASVPDDSEGLVWVLGRSLPYVIPNVLLNKRDELVPLILSAIRQHADKSARETLLAQLFSLVKKPEPDQRAVIVTGCASLAATLPDSRVKDELLPQLGELIQNKHIERRILAADLYGAISPYLRPDLSEAFVIPNLALLLQDKSEEVREAAVKGLALVVATLPKSNFKGFDRVFELLLSALKDQVERVVNAARQSLLPSVCEWAAELGVFESKIGDGLLSSAEALIRTDGRSLFSDTTAVELEILFGIFKMLTPFLFTAVLKNAPFYDPNPPKSLLKSEAIPAPEGPHSPADVAMFNIEFLLGDASKVTQLRNQLDAFIAKYLATPDSLKKTNTNLWSSLSWLLHSCLPRLLQIAALIDVSNGSSTKDIIAVFSTICTVFGPSFTISAVKPIVWATFMADPHTEEEFMKLRALRTRTLSVYVLGVLAALPEKLSKPELLNAIRNIALNMALEENNWRFDQLPALTAVIADLCDQRILVKEMVDLMWDLLVHPTLSVRLCIVEIFRVLVKFVDAQTISKRVLPALITLSSDPEPEVRHSSIATFGVVALSASEKQIVEKVKMQFQTLLDDTDKSITMEVINTFRTIIPQTEPHFRDEFIIPKLATLSHEFGEDKQNTSAFASSLNVSDLQSRANVANALLDALKTALQCFVSEELMAESILPSIRSVRKATGLFSDSQKDEMDRLIAECEAKLQARNSLSLQGEDSTRKKLLKVLANVQAAAKNEPLPGSRPSGGAAAGLGLDSSSNRDRDRDKEFHLPASVTLAPHPPSAGGSSGAPAAGAGSSQENKTLKSVTDLFRRK